jgi:two-component system sensor histidine kinase AtoS
MKPSQESPLSVVSPVRPRRWDVRMIVSVPALVLLLVLAMSTAHYLVVDNIIKGISARVPDYDSSPVFGQLLAVYALFIVLALLAGLLLVRTILLPIYQVSSAADNIAMGLSRAELEMRGGFEVDKLSRSFNSMVGYLRDMISERDGCLDEAFVVGSMVVDLSGRICSINAMGMSILKSEREHLVGMKLSEVREKFPDLAPNLMQFCIDATERDVSLAATETFLEPQGEGAMPLSVAFSFLRDEKNRPTAIIFQFRDATRMQNLNQMFSRTDQLAALGTFTIGLSHELRNPLGAIKGTVQLLEESLKSDDDARRYTQRIIAEVDRLDKLVRELYDFSRAPNAPFEVCDLNQLVSDSLERVRSGLDDALTKDKKIAEAYAVPLPRVVVQRDRVMRAVSNIIINAFEHMPPGARLSVRTRTLTNHMASPVVLDIVNTGSRIPHENAEKIFEPFFSTRQGGTGLGLAIAYQIVTQNQGALELVPTQDETVNFRFIFRNTEPLMGGG